MIRFAFRPPADRPLRVLAVGAHADDIEIGAGGSLIRLADELPDLCLDWLVLSADGTRRAEAMASPCALLASIAPPRVTVHDFRDGFFPGDVTAIKETVIAARERGAPDIVLCPSRDDRHQDHRLVADIVWQVFRDQTILEYEIPKWDGDLGRPNVYMALDGEVCERKIDHLLAAFPSQRERSWFTAETFRSMLRIRGIEADAATDYAEAFTCRKILL